MNIHKNIFYLAREKKYSNIYKKAYLKPPRGSDQILDFHERSHSLTFKIAQKRDRE